MSLEYSGAIARSKGKWYRVKFRCQTTADGLDVIRVGSTELVFRG